MNRNGRLLYVCVHIIYSGRAHVSVYLHLEESEKLNRFDFFRLFLGIYFLHYQFSLIVPSVLPPLYRVFHAFPRTTWRGDIEGRAYALLPARRLSPR